MTSPLPCSTTELLADHHHHHQPQQQSTAHCCTSNNKSIDSLILNSPSSLHRLQTLTRKQRTPLSNRPSCEPSDRLNSIDLSATSPDALSSPVVNGVGSCGGGILSSASSMLYLSEDICSTVACSPEQFRKPNYSSSEGYCSSHRSSTPFTCHSGSSSGGTGSGAGHSIAYYLNMHSLDRFLSLTHFTIRLAFYMLPLLWILVAIAWIVYMRAQNRYLKAQLLIDYDSTADDVSSPERIGTPSMEHSVAAWCTVLTLVATVFFIAIFIIKSHWAYSFEFVPAEEEDTEDVETTTSVSALSPDVPKHLEAVTILPACKVSVKAAEVEGPIKVNVIAEPNETTEANEEDANELLHV